ncbi:ABC transporter [Criibacterium bergeronii]|uniref:ABC transporter n=1 Tax=Criibacterium bergeronii TaxID=1871336 RepID=A0A552V386_9FIRM|nr:ABC transporter [Criibacterium bergeronii]
MLPLTEAKDHRFYDFLFSFDPHNLLCAICGKMFLSARVFTAHQGSFLKSSKLVVNSTYTLANILAFQGF